jgi:hypothetical protein
MTSPIYFLRIRSSDGAIPKRCDPPARQRVVFQNYAHIGIMVV